MRMFNNDAAWYGDRTVHGGTVHGGTASGDSSHSSPGPSVHAQGLYDSMVSGGASSQQQQPHQPSSPMAMSGSNGNGGGGRRDPMYPHMMMPGVGSGSSSAGGGSLYATPPGPEDIHIRNSNSNMRNGGGTPPGAAPLVYSSSAQFDRDDCVLTQTGDLHGCASAPPLQGSLEAAAASGSLPGSSTLLSLMEEEDNSGRMPSALTPAR